MGVVPSEKTRTDRRLSRLCKRGRGVARRRNGKDGGHARRYIAGVKPPRRSLPTPEEAHALLQARRTRPPPRPPPVAGRALAGVLKGLDARHQTGPYVLRARWREIAGETLARRSEPVRLVKGRGGSGGMLEVRVDGPAAALLQHQAPELLQRAALVLGEGAATRLRIVQGPVRAPAVAAAPRAASGRRRASPPLDAAAEAALQAELAEAPEGPLRDALRRLGRAVRQGAR